MLVLLEAGAGCTAYTPSFISVAMLRMVKRLNLQYLPGHHVQVISGMLAVSIAAEIGGAAFAILGSSMKRIGLSNLYEAHKFPYPTKAEVEQLMSEGKTARCVP